MKKLFIYILLSVTSIGVAQTELPLENYPNGGNPDGIYFKDINGILDGYLGTWRWTEGNRELTLYLYKDEEVTFTNPIRGTFQRDVIFGYYVYKEGGNILIDTKSTLLSRIDDRDWIRRGGVGLKPISNGYGPDNLPLFYYADYSRTICRDGQEIPFNGEGGFWEFTNATSAIVGLATMGTYLADCGFTDIHPNFPRHRGITITRISSTAPPLD